MRLCNFEAESLGKRHDLSGFSRFGEVTVYEKTTEEECPGACVGGGYCHLQQGVHEPHPCPARRT